MFKSRLRSWVRTSALVGECSPSCGELLLNACWGEILLGAEGETDALLAGELPTGTAPRPLVEAFDCPRADIKRAARSSTLRDDPARLVESTLI